ncbi:hypothetical protein [Streptomyces ficellus]|uniref:Uncharacterized protein n=1 Tax=Streptomyces ficellus TaxID=1977088 RepID=A0A6I6FH44_9ACTN|nr:hypothetical protein [Streptomyces ficellus]QGV78355.1 hypothetical protein EIZ62_08970 [Streptomyces ficellus]
MFTYELQQALHADLVREADTQRLLNLARSARKSRFALGRRSGAHAPEGRVNTEHDRFVTAA